MFHDLQVEKQQSTRDGQNGEHHQERTRENSGENYTKQDTNLNQSHATQQPSNTAAAVCNPWLHVHGARLAGATGAQSNEVIINGCFKGVRSLDRREVGVNLRRREDRRPSRQR